METCKRADERPLRDIASTRGVAQLSCSTCIERPVLPRLCFVNWSHAFPHPIDIDDANQVTTLAQARDMVLSAVDFRAKSHWQAASHALLTAAESGAPDDVLRARESVAAAIAVEGSMAPVDERKPKATTRAERAQRWIERAQSMRKPKADE